MYDNIVKQIEGSLQYSKNELSSLERKLALCECSIVDYKANINAEKAFITEALDAIKILRAAQ